jgi:hypothetical protein
MTKTKCERWCGRGCTQAEHDAAIKVARATARRLGPGWRATTVHNLGWYPRVVSECGRIKVSPWVYQGRVQSYTAYLGSADSPGGNWAERGTTPGNAVRAVIDKGRAALAKIGAMLCDLPEYKRR